VSDFETELAQTLREFGRKIVDALRNGS